MPTVRRFTGFKKDAPLPRIKDIPDGGFCISAFVIISKTGNPHQVLMGRLNREAQWDHLGALYTEMVERHSKGWMLPSSQLIFGESPHEAAQRILLEQLGLNDQKLEEPRVFSEVYGPRGHWDLEFLFLGERECPPTHPAWRELKFVDLASTKKEDIARSHEDILAHVGKWKTTQ
jgi:ADP-ribose pyrophosphatase YjhB (NUDIX family)